MSKAIEALKVRLERVEAAIGEEHRHSLRLARELRESHASFDEMVTEQRELKEALLVLRDRP